MVNVFQGNASISMRRPRCPKAFKLFFPPHRFRLWLLQCNYFSHRFCPPFDHALCTNCTSDAQGEPEWLGFLRRLLELGEVPMWQVRLIQAYKILQRTSKIFSNPSIVCLFVARLNPLERLDVGCWWWMLVDVHEVEESHFRHLDTFGWSLGWACLGQLKRLRRQPATVCRLFKSFINNLYIIL